MKRLLLSVGLLIALAALVSGESRNEDEKSLEKTEFDLLLDRNPRNADPKRRKNSSRKVKKQRRFSTLSSL